MAKDGLFLALVGIDGIGKSLALQNIKTLFNPNTLYLTKEPGDKTLGSNVGKGIRDLLFYDPTAKAMAPGVADLLFLADHIQNSYDIASYLEKGYTVISDRYADCQFAYSASKSKQSPDWALSLYKEQYGTIPDLIIFLRGVDINSGWTLKRAKARTGDEAGKQEGKPWGSIIGEQIAIQQAYEDRFNNMNNVVTIDIRESDTIETSTSKVIQVIQEFIANRSGYGQGV